LAWYAFRVSARAIAFAILTSCSAVSFTVDLEEDDDDEDDDEERIARRVELFTKHLRTKRR